MQTIIKLNLIQNLCHYSLIILSLSSVLTEPARAVSNETTLDTNEIIAMAQRPSPFDTWGSIGNIHNATNNESKSKDYQNRVVQQDYPTTVSTHKLENDANKKSASR